MGEGWGEEVGRASDDWGLGFPHPQGLGEQVPPTHDRLHITSNLGSALAVDRWVGAHGHLEGASRHRTLGSVLAPGWFRDREGSTLKGDQAGNTSNRTTKGGASQSHRWGTVCTAEGRVRNCSRRRGSADLRCSWGGIRSRHICGKRQDVSRCLWVLRARLSAPLRGLTLNLLTWKVNILCI